MQPPHKIAIIGGGPAGSTLAALLSRAGCAVALFHRGKRPPIIVGESLVPAVVPFLRELDIEEEVAGYGVLKQGATFVFNPQERLNIKFAEVRGARTTYSYNVPRDLFDATLLAAAERSGATVFRRSAHLQRIGDSDRVCLDAESLAEAAPVFGGDEPDFIVDAGGRTHKIPGLFGIPHLDGARRDTALHAHVTGVEVEIPGNVHTDRLAHGWAWRIPLPGRVSVGFVVNTEYIQKFGNTPEEQYDNYLRHDPIIRTWAAPAARVTPVVKYTNYQRRTLRGAGENWALVGDTFGFIDPVFSSGVLIAFQSAAALAEALRDASPRALLRYQAFVLKNLRAWQRIADYFYSGNLLTLFKIGDQIRRTRVGKLLDFHFRKYMSRIFTGENTTNRYSLGLVGFMAKYGLPPGCDPSELRIH